ncbi:nuclear transport factor 2 family protein [Georgenia wutianyii]|uniref:Nuclear transport factor 2 family protein n=1 Tax=Georgenia wutianyii TaxID=2585135 RepID=A0ABX5VKN7_9MICO|nr:nuclear transport factor 2 family protein [Georgenia wutianyii]QDB79022.1 nuclear transport factor 2 family protein [Georgenia wutianyii]
MGQDLRQEMRGVLDAWAQAIVANDADRIGAYAAQDWVLVGTGGTVDRRQFLDLVRSGRLTHEEMGFEVLDVRELGDVVVVLAHGTNSGHWEGRSFHEDEYTTDVFARDADGAWRCVVTTLTPRAQ